MPYTKTTWSDRIVSNPSRYRDQNDNQLTFTRDEGTITNAGTTVTAQRMNNIEDGILAVEILANKSLRKSKIYAYKNLGGSL